jgi:hypothetical protein
VYTCHSLSTWVCISIQTRESHLRSPIQGQISLVRISKSMTKSNPQSVYANELHNIQSNIKIQYPVSISTRNPNTNDLLEIFQVTIPRPFYQAPNPRRMKMNSCLVHCSKVYPVISWSSPCPLSNRFCGGFTTGCRLLTG